MRAPEPRVDAAADLALLVEASREAAEIALGFWRQGPKTWEKPGDEGPVSEADLAVDAHLRGRLTAARPDYGWISEETAEDGRALGCRAAFVVDPIDGTRAFLRGEETWAHALAVVVDGAPVAGVVHLPAKGDRLYAARSGGGAQRDGAAIRARGATPGLEDAALLVTKQNTAPGLWRRPVPALNRHFRPSMAYRLALVAEGRYDGMLTLRDAWEWDIAAGVLIAAEAGARVSDRTGGALAFNAPGRKAAGVVAAPATLHAEIVARLAPGARIA